MARSLALVAFVVVGLVGSTAAHADESGSDLTGVNDSETDEHVVPEVEGVASLTPQPVDEPNPTVVAPAVPHYSTWLRLAACESGGDWQSASNPRYKGGLQFDSPTWARHGGLAYAWRADFATPTEQMLVAERTLNAQGWAAWPACSRRLGLR